MNAALGIMTRLPEPGRVKTRLIPALGAEGACRVHRYLVDRTLETAAGTGLPVELFVTGETSPPPGLLRAVRRMHRQVSGGLGRRMAHALARLHAAAPRVLLLGSDCPELSPEYLLEALAWLEKRDFVVGPAHDGGYVLLGSAMPSFWGGGDPLEGVTMGTSRALEDTLRVLEPAGSVARLSALRDVDEPADLQAVFSSGQIERILAGHSKEASKCPMNGT